MRAKAALSVGSSSLSNGFGPSNSMSLPSKTSTNSSDRVLPNASRIEHARRTLAEVDERIERWLDRAVGAPNVGQLFQRGEMPTDDVFVPSLPVHQGAE